MRPPGSANSVPAVTRYAFFPGDSDSAFNPTGSDIFLNTAAECPQGLCSVGKSAGLCFISAVYNQLYVAPLRRAEFW